jgi:hypothetical protein
VDLVLSALSEAGLAVVPIKPGAELTRFFYDLTDTGVNYLSKDEYTEIVKKADLITQP